MELLFNGECVTKSPREGHLSFQQRFSLAQAFYGMYTLMLPSVIGPGGVLHTPETLQFELSDIWVAMDAVGVPREETSLTQKETDFLSNPMSPAEVQERFKRATHAVRNGHYGKYGTPLFTPFYDPEKLQRWVMFATEDVPSKTLSTIKPDDTLEMLKGATAGIITIDYGKTKPCLMDADEFGNLSGLPAGRSNNNDDSI